MVRILLVDEHDVVRHGLRSLMEMQAGWSVVGEARSVEEAVEMAAATQPDVVILDILPAERGNLEATRGIRRASADSEILVFASDENEHRIRDVLAAGARGYVLKSDPAQSVVAAVEAVARHRPYFSAVIAERILGGFVRGAGTETSRLTKREKDVVQLLAEGQTNRQIAAALGISVKTVEAHRAAAMRKVNARSIVDLVRYAVLNGMTRA